MIKITIECDKPEELLSIIEHRDKERDGARERINELEKTPLEFSLPKLARDVLENSKMHLTPDQKTAIGNLIKAGGSHDRG